MTEEQKRIKIAEALGWTGTFGLGRAEGMEREGGDLYGFIGTDPEGDRYPVPDYFNDLNACAEAYKSLSLVDQMSVLGNLFNIVKDRCASNIDGTSVWMVAVNAGPSERSEAFGIALALWKEGE